MVLAVRMKNVTRFLLFMGSLLVWFVLLVLLNDSVFGVKQEEVLIIIAFVIGVVQTWLIAYLMGT